ncbi:SUN domain-containing protein 2-like [Cylas formicarius]|uniref:SUN domain-containing protein 2-like n=1 Tax=Cylas formicarius TaxID=197179 RepID=UPI00295863E6|nr:SUN domain-containing protein 2-like [Cylas formicarius]
MVYSKTNPANKLKDIDSYWPAACHRYNTRLSAKLLRTPSNSRVFDELEGSSVFSSSVASDDTSPARLDIETLDMFARVRIGIADRVICDQRSERRRETVTRVMGWALVVVVLGWYVNHVRYQVTHLSNDVENLKISVKELLDARMDILYKVHKIAETQENLRTSTQLLVQREIEKLYSDKTGKTDFALESAGGSIVQVTAGTENYGQPKNSLLGISLCEGVHGPRSMIQTGSSPGECWALKGSSGGAIIKLLGSVRVDAVSMEHISKTISPSGDSSTAPKDFAVWGLKAPGDRGQLLGQFVYDTDGPLVQTFDLPRSAVKIFEYIELRILSNHGNPDFTCVYRFRVHGRLESGRP